MRLSSQSFSAQKGDHHSQVVPAASALDDYLKPTPPILQQKSMDPQLLLAKQRLPARSQTASVQRGDSNQSSICKFAPKHSEEDASPYKGRYQHILSNEELVSDRNRACTPCELGGESVDKASIDHWVNLNVRAGPLPSADISHILPQSDQN